MKFCYRSAAGRIGSPGRDTLASYRFTRIQDQPRGPGATGCPFQRQTHDHRSTKAAGKREARLHRKAANEVLDGRLMADEERVDASRDDVMQERERRGIERLK